MSDVDNEEALNLAIDVCAEFEKQTGLKTSVLNTKTQQELACETGLTLKNIKKWASADALARKLLLKLQKTS